MSIVYTRPYLIFHTVLLLLLLQGLLLAEIVGELNGTIDAILSDTAKRK